MTDEFVAIHKAKHILSHVLVAAGARRWPGVTLGESGETEVGFYADFFLPGTPGEGELDALTNDMARLLREASSFRDLEFTLAEALETFAHHPWKRRQIEAIAEWDHRVQCFELDGVIDVCDCVIKDPSELRAIHPEKFLLTGARPRVWSHRGREELFTRISGEIFPAPPPCECCRASTGFTALGEVR